MPFKFNPITGALDFYSEAQAPAAAKYLVATAHTDLTAEIDLGALTTGLLLSTVSGGESTISIITNNSTNWDTAYGWGNHASAGYAASGHNHAGVYEPADATILKSAAIGVSVQAYNATLAAVAGGTYAGDDSITTVGTITAGVWNGTDIAVADGGTGASTAAEAASNLGLGTEDSPTFSTITLQRDNYINMFCKTSGDNASGGYFNIQKSRGTNASPTAALLNDELGGFIFKGHATGSTYYQGAKVIAIAAENFGAGYGGTDLIFYTTAIGASSPTAKYTIDSDAVAITQDANSQNTRTTDSPTFAGITSNGQVTILKAKSSADSLDYQLMIQDTTAYNGSPSAGILFQNKYTSGGTQVSLGGIDCFKENAVDGEYGSILAFHTRANGGNITERMRIDSAGNVSIAGTAQRASTVGTNALHIFNGTAPVGTLTNGCSIYSTSGELYTMDAAGNATLQTPHDDENYWVFDSVNTVTGKRLVIDMEKMMRKLNEKFGWDFIHELIS